MALLYKSEEESNLLQLNVARCKGYVTALDAAQIRGQVFAEGYDICRIKLEGTHTSLFKSIEEVGFPYSIYTVNYHNQLNITPLLKITEGYKAIEYNNTHQQALHSILQDVFESRGWFEYENDRYSTLISTGQEREVFMHYFSNFTDALNGRHTYLLFFNEIPVGVFIGYVNGDRFYGILYGVLSSERGKGSSKEIYKLMNNICFEMGLKYFENDVSIFNIPSQRSTVSSGLVPDNIHFNVILYPMLGSAGGVLEGGNVDVPAMQLFSRLGNMYFNNLLFSINVCKNTNEEAVTYRANGLYSDNQLKEIVVKLFNAHKQLVSVAYLQAK
jgi:hypothetical protein